jgi:hypothetical protein
VATGRAADGSPSARADWSKRASVIIHRVTAWPSSFVARSLAAPEAERTATSSTRWDLCGGPSAMAVPTAIHSASGIESTADSKVTKRGSPCRIWFLLFRTVFSTTGDTPGSALAFGLKDVKPARAAIAQWRAALSGQLR